MAAHYYDQPFFVVGTWHRTSVVIVNHFDESKTGRYEFALIRCIMHPAETDISTAQHQ